MRRWWIVSALLAGCHGAPSCDDVASELAHFAPRSSRVSIASTIGSACERDAWSAEARRCLKWVERRSRVHRCSSDLSEKQTDWLAKQLEPDEQREREALRNDDPPPPPPPEHTTITVDVADDGTASSEVSFGGRTLTREELDQLFRLTADTDPLTTVVIRSSSSAPHGAVVTVMEAAKAAGLHDLAIATK